MIYPLLRTEKKYGLQRHFYIPLGYVVYEFGVAIS